MFISNDLDWSNLGSLKPILMSNKLEVTISGLCIILGLLCWMNEKCAHMWLFPLSLHTNKSYLIHSPQQPQIVYLNLEVFLFYFIWQWVELQINLA